MITKVLKTFALAAVVLATTAASFGESPDVLPPVPEEDVRKIEAALPKGAMAPPKTKRKILVMWRCNGFYHQSIPWGNRAIELMGEKTGAWETTTTDDVAAFSAQHLEQFDAIVLNNTTSLEKTMTDQQKQAILDFVQGGKGLIGIHGATDNFKTWPDGAEMIGAIFNGHPWGAGSTVKILLEDPDHPINRAFQGRAFTIQDEIYQFREPYSREDLRILLALDLYDPTTLGGARHLNRADWDYAVSWIKDYGRGRVFVCSLGHRNDIFWNPTVLQHYLDGMQYAIGDLKGVDATPSSELFQASAVEKTVPELVSANGQKQLADAERKLGVLLSRVIDKDEAVAPILDAVPTTSGPARDALLRLAARSNSTKALRALIANLSADDAAIRKATIAGLAHSTDPQAAVALIETAAKADSETECTLALKSMSCIVTLPAARDLDELLDTALDAARTDRDRALIIGLYAEAADVKSLRKVAAMLERPRLRDPAINAVLDLSNQWTLKSQFTDDVVAACERVIAMAPNEQIKTKARQRIEAAEKARKR